MAAPLPPLLHDRDFAPEIGAAVPVAPGLVRITAPNAGPYSFTGTNSFLIGKEEIAVLDPGPDSGPHLAALLRAIGGRRAVAIILTHTHRDHSDLVHRLAAVTKAPIWSGGPHRLSRPRRTFERNPTGRDSDFTLVPDRKLLDGEQFSVGGVTIEVIATPGHAANHLAFGLVDTPHLLSGDHVMGWSTTLVAVPDGSMRDYFRSLDKVAELPYRTYHPGHGGPIADAPGYVRALKAHREGRNAQILDAVAAGADRVGALRQAIYPLLKVPLAGAADMTIRAHLEYLAEQGKLRLTHGLLGLRIGPAQS
jgi:glyoxylase-like metal-dependent hydrolase (beta-lactamase superfamily II)